MRRIRAPGAVPTEHAEQSALFTWAGHAQAAHPVLRLLYAIPNGGRRIAKVTATGIRYSPEAKKLKREGVKAGVLDVCLPVARGPYHGLYIEMKRKKGSTTSDEQKQWIADLTEQEYRAVVCKGWEEARAELLHYLSLGQKKAPA